LTRIDLGPAWGALGQIEGRIRELQARELETAQVEGRSAFVAIDWEGHRHLLVPMHGDLHPSPDERGAGIRVTTRDLVDGGATNRFLDVVCLKPHLNGLFDVVASDILTACGEASLERVPAECRGVLERWRELLEEVAAGKIATSVLAGAWGELWFVRELLDRGAAWPGLWVGPTGAVHDIKGAGGSHLEVKATTARGPLFVEIHGIGQLDIPDEGSLLLGVLRLTGEDEQGQSIADLVRACVGSGANHTDLVSLLANVGVTSGAPEYDGTRFAVKETRLYRVGNAFPRIVPSSLVAGAVPAAVINLSYQLDLTTDSPGELSAAETEEALRHLAGTSA
jgi:hypothetical protein